MTIPRPIRLPFVVHRCLREVHAVLARAGIEREHVVVAVSGGSDSMALLELVALAAAKAGLALEVASIDHGMRESSAAEVEMARAAAARHGAGFHTRRVDPGRGDENSLRRARHAALDEIAHATGSRFVLLGHTSDDQIETIVFRFLRGAGLRGLSGMREIRGRLVRPLLGLRREDLRDVLRALDLSWIDDPSNDSARYARGRLRRDVLPAIRAAFGEGALNHLLDVAPRWREDDDALELDAQELLAFATRVRGGHRGLAIDAIAGVHGAIRARALRRWLTREGVREPTSRELGVLERWLDGAGGDGGVDVAGARVVRSGLRLRIEKVDAAGDPARHAGGALPASSGSSLDDDDASGRKRR